MSHFVTCHRLSVATHSLFCSHFGTPHLALKAILGNSPRFSVLALDCMLFGWRHNAIAGLYGEAGAIRRYCRRTKYEVFNYWASRPKSSILRWDPLWTCHLF